MPRTSTKEKLAEKQDLAAPFLFDEENLPQRLDIVDNIASGKYQHTGARLLDNDGKTLRLVEMLLHGWGVRKIARSLAVSKWTVRAAREELARQGKLAPYKERVVKLYEDIVEAGAHQYRDALEDGLVSPSQIPVGIGIIADKRALALGEATSISATAADPARSRELSVEALNAWIDGLKLARPVESQSTVPPALTEGKP